MYPGGGKCSTNLDSSVSVLVFLRMNGFGPLDLQKKAPLQKPTGRNYHKALVTRDKWQGRT